MTKRILKNSRNPGKSRFVLDLGFTNFSGSAKSEMAGIEMISQQARSASASRQRADACPGSVNFILQTEIAMRL